MKRKAELRGDGASPKRPTLRRAAVGALALLALGCGPGRHDRVDARMSVATAMAGDPAGFLRAEGPRPFDFPADHGPHPGFRTEWWYWTGNLATADGRRFGYQLTFFRNELAPPGEEDTSALHSLPSSSPPPTRGGANDPPLHRTAGGHPSAWRTRELWFAHFTVSDVAGESFHAAERWQRGALDLAGAYSQPFRVWVGAWSAEARPGGLLPLRLQAAADDDGFPFAFDLTLSAGKPLVLQGEDGWSRKGSGVGNASYYYSLTRLPTVGTVTVDGQAFAVTGASWLDREWSTSALDPGVVGWDWFALQLADGRELMLYLLRRQDGGAAPESAGTLVAADGSARRLAREDFAVEVRDRWRSPATGVVYPARWAVRVPAAGLELEVVPRLAGQELDLSVRYWEGAVRVDGTAPAGKIAGEGYVELTGYEGYDAPPAGDG